MLFERFHDILCGSLFLAWYVILVLLLEKPSLMVNLNYPYTEVFRMEAKSNCSMC